MKRFSIILLTILVLAGCGLKEQQSMGNGGFGTDTDTQNHEKAIYEKSELKNGVEFHLKVKGNSFETDEEIEVYASVKNINNFPISYIGYDGCDTGLNIRLPIPQYQSHFLTKEELSPSEDQIVACTDAIVTKELKPGEIIETTEVFVPKMRLSSETVNVSAGGYNIEAIFQMGLLDQDPPDHFTIQFPISVSGEEAQIITTEQAEKVAESHSEVKQWMTNHSGEAIAKKEGEQHYILFYDGWQKVTKDLYDELKEGIYQKEKQIYYENGQWVIEYLSKLGKPPHRLQVQVDAVNAEVTSIQKFDK